MSVTWQRSIVRCTTRMCINRCQIVIFNVIEKIKDILSFLQSSCVISKDMTTCVVFLDSKQAHFTFSQRCIRMGLLEDMYVSAVGSPTDGLSRLLYHFIQPFVPNIPSYIRNTQDFLDRLHALCPLPVDYFYAMYHRRNRSIP